MIAEDGAQETEVAKEGILLIIWLLDLILLDYTYCCQGYFRPLYFFSILYMKTDSPVLNSPRKSHVTLFKDS